MAEVWIPKKTKKVESKDELARHISYEMPVQSEECEIQYPTSKNKIIKFRLKDIDPQNGIFTYYVFYGDQIIKTDTFTSNICKNYYSKLNSKEKVELENQFNKISFVDEKTIENKTEKKFEALKKYYLNDDYKDTSTQVHLNASEYFVAVISMDQTIIDIKSSIKHNKIILNPEYTTGDNELVKLMNLSFLTFIFDWTTKASFVLEMIKYLLFGIFLPFTLALLVFTKASKKVQKLHDTDDLIERAGIGVLIFIMFLQSPYILSDGKINEKIKSAESGFLSEMKSLVGTGAGFADQLSNVLTETYLNKIARTIGIASQKEVKQTIEDTLILEKNFRTFKYYQTKCYANLSDTFMTGMDGMSDDFISKFPISEGFRFDESLYFINWNDPKESTRLTLTFCRNIDKKVYQIDEQIKRNKEFVKNISKEINTNIISNYISIATNMLKEQAEYGFIYAPFVLFNQIFLENLGLFQDFEHKSERYGLEYIAYNMPWLSAPGASTALSVYKDLSPTMVAKETTKETVSSVPFAGNGLGVLARYAINKHAYAIIIPLIKSVYIYFPLIAVTIASILSIGLFAIILYVYLLVAPLYVVFVFASNSRTQVISFILRGFVIAFKPVMIVVSVVLAILAISVISGFGYAMTKEIFGFFSDITLLGSLFSFEPTKMLFAFLHGLVDLVIAIAISIFAFIFVYKGAVLILNVFGYKESGVDVQESIGDIESRLTQRGV